LADATERSLRDGGLLEIRSDDAAAVGAFSLDHAGIDGVDPDLLRPELSGEHAGDGVNRALGAGVNRAVRRCDATGNGADIDDAGAFAEVLDGCLRGERRPSTLTLNALWNCSSVMASMGVNSYTPELLTRMSRRP
jgi:hypothetical protein